MKFSSIISRLYTSLFICFIIILTLDYDNNITVLATPEIIEDAVDTIKTKAIDPLYEKYEELPPNGRFGVGLASGYVGTKVSIRSTVKAAKYTGAAFLLSEVLNQTGMLDKVAPSGNGDEMLSKLKRKMSNTVNHCRSVARENLSYEKIQSCFEKCVKKDRMGTLGLTTGAVAGLIF
jgi:hypothetical protein